MPWHIFIIALTVSGHLLVFLSPLQREALRAGAYLIYLCLQGLSYKHTVGAWSLWLSRKSFTSIVNKRNLITSVWVERDGEWKSRGLSRERQSKRRKEMYPRSGIWGTGAGKGAEAKPNLVPWLHALCTVLYKLRWWSERVLIAWI